MVSRIRAWSSSAIALAALAHTACAGTQTAELPCPNVAIVADAADVTKFLPGPGRDLTDVVTEARIDDFDGFCTTYTDAGSRQVEVELRLVIIARRGPANRDRQAELEYFVAIGDRNNAILAKATFARSFGFEGNRATSSVVEELAQHIPLRNGETGANFNILIGFQLSDEELQYNRARVLR